MVSDARLNIGFPHHPKTQKLRRRLGADGTWSLVCLILWTAANRSNGLLSGMTHEDLEIAAGWEGGAGVFVNTLIEVGFLDQLDDALALHDWIDHNPWAFGSDERSEKARYAALRKYHPKERAEQILKEGTANRDSASSMRLAENRSAPSPSPSPSPFPKPNPLPDPTGKDGLASEVNKPDEVDSQIWADFLALRVKQNNPLNNTSWNHIAKQLEKGKQMRYSLNDMLSELVASGWRTFNLEWYQERKRRSEPVRPSRRLLDDPANRWLK